jgi:hypothetical protein
MSRKVIFIVASALIFFILDQTWVFPSMFAYLPQVLGWFIASALSGVQIVALIYEWHYWGALNIL